MVLQAFRAAQALAVPAQPAPLLLQEYDAESPRSGFCSPGPAENTPLF